MPVEYRQLKYGDEFRLPSCPDYIFIKIPPFIAKDIDRTLNALMFPDSTTTFYYFTDDYLVLST